MQFQMETMGAPSSSTLLMVGANNSGTDSHQDYYTSYWMDQQQQTAMNEHHHHQHQLAPPTYISLQQQQQHEQHFDYSYAYGTFSNDCTSHNGEEMNIQTQQHLHHGRLYDSKEEDELKLHHLQQQLPISKGNC